ncbi:uncharacterized protein LOC128553201 [Mercenaria mercenaria]|uniref:uncharacterized protein LOC128553201 n=1 Tax=Mercenaria mercenaria TaxID=6596 RepID=UPI00234FA935|nr:uncharacterized protein LOC128553201 [Mercenaria mercenaria]
MGQDYFMQKHIKPNRIAKYKRPRNLYFAVIGATISLKSSDDRLTRLVEETTKRVFKAALKESGDKELTSKVVAAVQKILQEVEHFDGVAISDVETHCIRLTIRCKTCRGLLELLKYFESDSFKETLKELCSALEEEYHCRFIITVEITKESLEEIMNNLKKDMSESMEEEQYQKEDDLQNRQQVHHDNSSVKDFIVTDRKVKIIIPFRSSYENFERKCKTWFNIPEQIRVVFFVTVGDEEIQLDNDAIATQPRLTKLIIEENITGFSEHMKEKGAIKQSMSVGSTTTTIKEGLRKSQNINYKITHEQGIQQTDDRTEGIVSGDNGKDSVFSPLKKVTGEETSASASGCMSIPELDSDDEEILSLEKELDALEKDEIKLRKVKQKEELRQKVIQKRKEVNALKGLDISSSIFKLSSTSVNEQVIDKKPLN